MDKRGLGNVLLRAKERRIRAAQDASRPSPSEVVADAAMVNGLCERVRKRSLRAARQAGMPLTAHDGKTSPVLGVRIRVAGTRHVRVIGHTHAVINTSVKPTSKLGRSILRHDDRAKRLAEATEALTDEHDRLTEALVLDGLTAEIEKRVRAFCKGA